MLSAGDGHFGNDVPSPSVPPAAEETTHFTWPAALALAAFAVGLLGVLGIAPFWALCGGGATFVVTRFVVPDWSARLLGMASAKALSSKHERVAVVLLFLAAPLAMTAAWDEATPRLMWSPWWLVSGVGAGAFVYAFALRRGGGGRPQRWWWAWLPLAVVVIGFFAVGGPFRVRWAYCEARLTAAVAAGESIEVANTGRFCWHDAGERMVEGERRLYFGSVDDGSGLVFSPDGAIEQRVGIRLLRDLGDGWYYFEEGSAIANFWFDS